MMDKEALNKVAKEAVDLWSQDNFEQAEPLFQEVLPHIDDGHWGSVDFLNYFACNQSALGKIDEAKALLERSLQVALATDDEKSITVTCGRICLADHLFRHGEYEKALGTIQPSLDIDGEQRKSLVLLYARIHMAMGNVEIAESAAREFLSLASDTRFKTIDDVLLRTETGQ